MYKNKNKVNGTNNLCGKNVRNLRIALTPRVSQQGLAHVLQLRGLDLDKNAIQRIESGQRFVTDIELLSFAQYFNVTIEELLK